MKFKAVKIISLLVAVLGASQMTLAEQMPESPKQKEIRIENDLNNLFKRGLDTAALQLNEKREVEPFAIIKRKDGKLGVFSLDKTEKNKSLSINQKAFSIRRYLSELAIAQEISASVLVMFATVKEPNKKARQGLSFEIEHIDGISMLRFLPVSDYIDEKDAANNKLVLETESLSSTIKPAVVFTDMVKAIVANKKN